MYLSNAEKEALQLTGWGDVPPWAVEQGLEQGLQQGTYVPGEESLRLRLADALDLEGRLAAAGMETREQQAMEAQQAEELAEYLAKEEAELLRIAGFLNGSELAQVVTTDTKADRVYMGVPQWDASEKAARHLMAISSSLAQLSENVTNGKTRLDLLNRGFPGMLELMLSGHGLPATTEVAVTEGQEAAEEPPADQWRSPLEIVTEGDTEAEQGAADEEEVLPPAAVGELIEDRDFSRFTKPELIRFAFARFGEKLKLADSKDFLIAAVQELVDEANETAV